MGNGRHLSEEASSLYLKFKEYAGQSKQIDLTMQALHKMNIKLGGMLILHLNELTEAGLIRYHVNDIPTIDLLH